MVYRQMRTSTRNNQQQPQRNQAQGIRKRRQPFRKSAKLYQTQQREENQSPPHLSISLKPRAILQSNSAPEPEAVQSPGRKRKLSHEAEASRDPPEKKLRLDSYGNRLLAKIDGGWLSVDQSAAAIDGDHSTASTNDNSTRRITSWLREGSYPKDLFESGTQTWGDIVIDTAAKSFEANRMDDPRLARKKSASDLRRQVLEASTDRNTSAPTEKTVDKSQPYRSVGYVAELEDQRSYLYDAPEGITDKSKKLCRKLLETKQAIPQDSLFRDDRFMETCRKVQCRNEARVVEDISPLIAPSPETLTTYGAVKLKNLVFNANERWDNSRPVTKTRPQPDGSVGFGRSAFTEGQVQKLLPYIGNRVPCDYISIFLATWTTFFPFFTREAKGATGDLEVADRQNAHSMTMAVRGVVELFKLVNREKELDRELIAFSVSHDAREVRLYGYYATIHEHVVSFWRHTISQFIFAEADDQKWTAYQFTSNIYFEFMPELLRLIGSAIDQLPFRTDPSLLRSVGAQQAPPDGSFTSTDLESDQLGSQEIAASASGSQNTTGFKKRKMTKAALERENEENQGQVQRLLGQVSLLQQQLLNVNSGNDSEVVTTLREELERQRQENERQRQENERQQQEMKEQISKLTNTVTILATQAQKASKE